MSSCLYVTTAGDRRSTINQQPIKQQMYQLIIDYELEISYD